MASIQETKRRIKAVTNTRQITKAMEMVSATKMRRSQEIALLSRPYALEVLRILGELSNRTAYTPKIMQAREVKRTAVVVIASDRGLAGSFNANVFRTFEKKIENVALRQAQGLNRIENTLNPIFIAVGKKAEEFLKRKGYTVEESFKNFGDFIQAEQTRPLSDMLVKGFLDGRFDRVAAVSTHFRSTLRQDVVVRDVLPISAQSVEETLRELVPEYGRFAGLRNSEGSAKSKEQHTNILENVGMSSGGFEEAFEYLIEPDPKSVLDALAPELVAITIYDLILEANASEHSARMVAMKNASENAGELKDELSLEFNKLRQSAITRELSEIVGGAEALGER